jgi:signal transduction histidine kinase
MVAGVKLFTFRLKQMFQDHMERFVHNGINDSLHSIAKLNIVVSNSFAILFASGSFSIWLYDRVFTHTYPQAGLLLFFSVLFLLPIYLNHKGKFILSRVIVSISPSVFILAYSVVAKLTIADITVSDFYNFKIALSIFCLLPLWIFSVKELRLLSFSFGFNFLCVSMADVVHHFFNVGYYDVGFIDEGYGFINITTVICTAIFSYGIVFMKRKVEEIELRNSQLVDRLRDSLAKIETQNETLTQQANALKEKQIELNKAYHEIENNKQWLEEELAVYDYEVTQFSYNVCHHLRGPIASIGGLVNILNDPKVRQSNIEDGLLQNHFKLCLNKLEEVVGDLNQVLRIRKDIFRIQSDVPFIAVINEATEMLKREITLSNAIVYVSIDEVDTIYASHHSLLNIIHNLLSNSLKFRDPNRPTQISVRCWRDQSIIHFSVRDNGLGIDLGQFKNQMFQMYKRFHIHVEGKGLGLYLVKLQLSAMGGTISVDSQPGKYTCFTFSLPDRNYKHQLTK